MRITLPSIVLASLLLVACSSDPTAQHTVSEYRADKELRRIRLAQCADNPGTLKDTPDCINARQATREDRTSLRELPVQLPKPDPAKNMVPATSPGRGAF